MRISDWSSDVCSSDLAIPAMPKAASVFSPFIGLPLILSVMCTCSFFVFLPGICAGSSTRGDAIIGMASAMHRMCLVGCQKQQWFHEIVRDGGRVKPEMTLQQCGIAKSEKRRVG